MSLLHTCRSDPGRLACSHSLKSTQSQFGKKVDENYDGDRCVFKANFYPGVLSTKSKAHLFSLMKIFPIMGDIDLK